MSNGKSRVDSEVQGAARPTLSSGADRRVIGVYAFLQGLLPWVVYLAAALVPAAMFAHRRGVARLG